MGLKYRTYLEGTFIYGCSQCHTHLSSSDAVMSRHFQGQHGQALFLILFSTSVNITQGPAEERNMITGRHIVRNIACAHCDTVLGWTYIKAFKEENKYKEGKFILEKKLLSDVH
ncbi:Yippee/Mis18 [Spinellus fusiger]|nr:Yippee/Mis18 [Spinellus fusiger]